MSSFPFAHGVGGSGMAPPVVGPSSPPAGVEGPSSDLEVLTLRVLKERLSTTPHEDKSWLVHVQRVRPELVDDVHLLRFLRVEDYDIELALKRLLKYWELRYKAFGPDNFCLPMTLNGAMRDCINAVENGNVTLLPVLDEAGRAVVYRGMKSYDEEFIKVWWYLVHVAMENPSAAKNGFVILSNARNVKLIDFDPKMMVAAFSSGGYAFPIRWKMMHVCHASSVFPRVAAAVKAALPAGVRKAFVLHNGSDESVLRSLSEYGLNRDCIPREMGGNLHFSTQEFMQQRIVVEGSVNPRQGGENVAYSFAGEASSDVLAYPSNMTAHISGPSNPGHMMEMMESCRAAQTSMAGHIHSKSAETLLDNSALLMEEQLATNPNRIAQAQRKRKHDERSNLDNDRNKPKPARVGRGKGNGRGRLGDPRMDRAMQMRIENPDMTLATALEAGGYIFPDLENPKGKVGDVLDTEGVTLYQRRNQLLRRLREAKKKEKGG